MAVQRLPQTPSQQAIEAVLATLCTEALRKWWILEKGRSLLGLDCVRAHLERPTDANSSEENYAIALRSYLETAVERVESPQNRSILEIVLGLGDDRWRAKEWREKSAETRREEAGRLFRGLERTVTAGTIRKLHEPSALRELAKIVWVDERELRKEPLEDAAETASSSS